MTREVAAMDIVINGESRQVDQHATLSSVLADFGVPERGVAVAVDGSVIPRAAWPETGLRPRAAVEILTAVQGG